MKSSYYDLTVAEKIIDDIESIGETHKQFYKHMIKEQFNLIIGHTYERLMSNE